jgi:transposase
MIQWEQHMDIITLHRQGLSMRNISEKLGVHRLTVKKYITQDRPPQYRRIKKKDFILAPYL